MRASGLFTSRRVAVAACAAGLLVCVARAPRLAAADGDAAIQAPVPKDRPSDDLLAKLAGNDMRFDDFKQMLALFGLKDAQEAAFLAKVKTFGEKITELSKSATGKQLKELRDQMKAAMEAKDQAKWDALNAKMGPLAEEYNAKRLAARGEVHAALSPDLQRYWIQYSLFRDLPGRFKGANLAAAQRDQIWKVCQEPAEKLAREGAAVKDPYLAKIKDTREALENSVKNSVLTKEQREALPKAGIKPDEKKP